MEAVSAAVALSAAHTGRTTSAAITVPIGCVLVVAGLCFLVANRKVGDAVWHTGLYKGAQSRLTQPGANGRYALVTAAGAWFVVIGAVMATLPWL